MGLGVCATTVINAIFANVILLNLIVIVKMPTGSIIHDHLYHSWCYLCVNVSLFVECNNTMLGEGNVALLSHVIQFAANYIND